MSGTASSSRDGSVAGRASCRSDSSHGAQSTGEDRHQTFILFYFFTFITDAMSIQEDDVVSVEKT